MISKPILEALSGQINAEIGSAYLYLAMSAYCDREGYKGFSNWMRVQAKEEMAHGLHIYEHVLDRGETPLLTEVSAPVQEFDGLVDVFARTLEHERKVTASINRIASLAMKEDDHATYGFIQWYVNEQIEEEDTADEILQKVERIGENLSMLLTLDTELGARTFVDPFAAQ